MHELLSVRLPSHAVRRLARAAVSSAAWIAIVFASSGCLALGGLGNYRFGVEVAMSSSTTVRTNFSLVRGMEATFVVESVRANATHFARASSSDPTVLRVVRADASRLVVEAMREGRAMLWVHGADGSSDYVDVRVAEPADVVLGEPLVAMGGGVAAVRVGESVRLSVRVEDAHGDELVAPPIPVQADPILAEDTDPVAVGGAVPPFFSDSVDVLFHSPGRVRLHGASGDGIVLDVIQPADVESFSVEDATSKLAGHAAAALGVAVLVPFVTVHGVRLPLLSRSVDVHLSTPEVCASVPSGPPLLDLARWPGAVVLTLKPGRCRVELAAFDRSTTFARTSAPLPLADAATTDESHDHRGEPGQRGAGDQRENVSP